MLQIPTYIPIIRLQLHQHLQLRVYFKIRNLYFRKCFASYNIHLTRTIATFTGKSHFVYSNNFLKQNRSSSFPPLNPELNLFAPTLPPKSSSDQRKIRKVETTEEGIFGNNGGIFGVKFHALIFC